MSAEKQRLRRRRLDEAAQLDINYAKQADAIICERLMALPEYEKAKVIYAYYGVGHEVKTQELILRAIAAGKTVALPVTKSDGYMVPVLVRDIHGLVRGKYGIPEPDEGAPLVEENDIDLILAPGLAFDRMGFRLGHGGGYYDRLLDRCPAFCVGLAREDMLVDRLIHEAHDKAVHCLITEKAVIRF